MPGSPQLPVSIRINGHADKHSLTYMACLAFLVSPDSRFVAAGSLDTIVRVWNTMTGQQVERLRGHKDSVYR
jgi:WD40 repeat protein